jgi:hypothetical protein
MTVYDLSSSYSSVPQGFILESCKTLRTAARRVEHALTQMNDDDIWWRPHDANNAAGNIVLHVCGNIGQRIIAGACQLDYTRDCEAEFARREPIAGKYLLNQFNATIDCAEKAVAELTEQQLLETRNIQEFETNVLTAVYHSVSHLEGHAQEIIYIARMRLGERYRFLWQPTYQQQKTL